MHKPRIIFFDIDGTLIDMEKKRITERTLDALQTISPQVLFMPYLQTSSREPPCAPIPGTSRKWLGTILRMS